MLPATGRSVEAHLVWRRRQTALAAAVRRGRPVGCWYLGRTELVVATLVATDDEPRLVDCAAVRCLWQPSVAAICPGLLEVAGAGAKHAQLHVAALDALPAAGAISSAGVADEVEIEIETETLRFARGEIADAAALFRRADLALVSLRAAAAARAELSRVLGAAPCAGAERSLAGDPLAAISVAPECETKASALGASLAVPVGLALCCLGSPETR